MTWLDTFMGEFAGNFFVLALLLISFLIIMLLMLRVSKIVFSSVLFVGTYALASSGFMPMWIFGIMLILVGLYIGKTLLSTFYSPN